MSINVKNLTYVYMPNTPFEKKALNDVSLSINNNDFAAIIGHTGSGKSTLIQHFNGLLKPTSGEVIIDGKNIFDSDVKLSDIRKKVGLVFQYPEYQLFEETIEKDIAFGPSKMGLNEEEIKIRVKKAMQVVGLSYEKYKDVSPFDLSGGQKRRAAIAGILAMEPKILILDEPTAGLDPKGRDEILAQIKKFHTEYNMTIILVSHSMEDVAKVANNIFVMSKGKCILRGEPKKVFKEIDILEETGLAAPAVTYLAKELKNRGLDISDEIFTVRQAAEGIFKMIDKKRNSLRRELE